MQENFTMLLNWLSASEADEASSEKIIINNEKVLKHVQKNLALYDKNGEQHYDIISAFIKSLRGSDPNAAVYWLARMVEGGEDPKFIARRMLILGSRRYWSCKSKCTSAGTDMF